MNTIKILFILVAALALQRSVQAADTYTIDPAHTRVGFSVIAGIVSFLLFIRDIRVIRGPFRLKVDDPAFL